MPTHAVVLRVVLVVAIVLGLFAGGTGHARTAGAQTVSVFGEFAIVRPHPTGGDAIYSGKVDATTDTVARTATVRVRARLLGIDTTITRPLLPNGGFRGQVQLPDGTRVLVRGRPVAGAILTVRFFSSPILGLGPAPGGAFLYRSRLRTGDPNDPPAAPTLRLERTASQSVWGSPPGTFPSVDVPVPITVEVLGELTDSPAIRLIVGAEAMLKNAVVTENADALFALAADAQSSGDCWIPNSSNWSVSLTFSKDRRTGQIVRLEHMSAWRSTRASFATQTGPCDGWVWTRVRFFETAPYADD